MATIVTERKLPVQGREENSVAADRICVSRRRLVHYTLCTAAHRIAHANSFHNSAKMGFALLAIYVGIILAVIVSAVRHRREGWRSGLFFALLLLTLPAWAMGIYWLLLKFQ